MTQQNNKLSTASISLRVLARLLAYPDAELRSQLSDMDAALQAEQALAPQRISELIALIHTLQHGDALENEAEYVQLFDRGRATSLHLFEHVHGDSRERGPAMIDLAKKKPQPPHQSNLFSTYSRWVLRMTKRSS